jgi:Xaa-Pro aminopeptidase
MDVTRTLILENFEEEKKNIRFLAQEMTAACSALIKESK